jgi:hypothetical protein
MRINYGIIVKGKESHYIKHKKVEIKSDYLSLLLHLNHTPTSIFHGVETQSSTPLKIQLSMLIFVSKLSNLTIITMR